MYIQSCYDSVQLWTVILGCWHRMTRMELGSVLSTLNVQTPKSNWLVSTLADVPTIATNGP